MSTQFPEFHFGLGDNVRFEHLNILKEVVVYFDQFAIGICQCLFIYLFIYLARERQIDLQML